MLVPAGVGVVSASRPAFFVLRRIRLQQESREIEKCPPHYRRLRVSQFCALTRPEAAARSCYPLDSNSNFHGRFFFRCKIKARAAGPLGGRPPAGAGLEHASASYLLAHATAPAPAGVGVKRKPKKGRMNARYPARLRRGRCGVMSQVQATTGRRAASGSGSAAPAAVRAQCPQSAVYSAQAEGPIIRGAETRQGQGRGGRERKHRQGHQGRGGRRDPRRACRLFLDRAISSN
ncbi:hypothetical protein THAOC_31123 [Thalassiosira oceanica]|uniref:Uncharacterized protein n=1 Tax=Thalassiosira oceanica TaxID=159749 RepID=K0R9W1_THAOC|nr:hypothetical protein THAOC_31123 [Thalassiosira oceanica]|eukprot:EJK49945.1 hypothetical protein THAOC_31123 [Thalassiosira oceanica]